MQPLSIWWSDSIRFGNDSDKKFDYEAFLEECRHRKQSIEGNLSWQVAFDADCFLLLPQEFAPEVFFRFHFPEHRDDCLQTWLLSDRKQQMVCALPENLAQLPKADFPQLQLFGLPYLLTEYALSADNKKGFLLIYLSDRHLQLFAAKNSQMIFANSFDIHSKDEARYFFFAVLQQLGQIAHALLCTENESMKSWCDLFRPYFSHFEGAYSLQELDILSPTLQTIVL